MTADEPTDNTIGSEKANWKIRIPRNLLCVSAASTSANKIPTGTVNSANRSVTLIPCRNSPELKSVVKLSNPT
ncbi:hypothetical protein D1872_282680 [compost metagenome]